MSNDPGLLTPGVTVLPPGCTTGCVTATNDGSYPQVWDNALADGSFGVTSPIFLDQLTPSGRRHVGVVAAAVRGARLPAPGAMVSGALSRRTRRRSRW
jgi:hypothetical protein